jgi:PadR family transcriptional regulator PadR
MRKGVLDCACSPCSRAGTATPTTSRAGWQDIGMGEGTIYPLMRRMQIDGLVKTYLEESSSGPPRKYYQLTKAGHAALAAQKAEWNSFITGVAKVMSDNQPAAPAAKTAGAGR